MSATRLYFECSFEVGIRQAHQCEPIGSSQVEVG
jgi:hypothetical protein